VVNFIKLGKVSALEAQTFRGKMIVENEMRLADRVNFLRAHGLIERGPSGIERFK
jgi:hypothetical protein